MNLSTLRCLPKVSKIPIYLSMGLLLLTAPAQVFAATCGGSISGSINPSEVLFPNLPQPVVVSLRAEVGTESPNMLVQELLVGMTCKDTGGGPGLSVPCLNGDDQVPSLCDGGFNAGNICTADADCENGSDDGVCLPATTPITFISYIDPPDLCVGGTNAGNSCTGDGDCPDGGFCQIGAPNPYPGDTIPSCGVTAAATETGNTNPDGKLVFTMPNQIVTGGADGGTGCRIRYNGVVNDKGTDSSPMVLSQIFNFNGFCGAGTTSPGGATGSLTVVLDDPVCEPEVEVCVAVDTDDDGSFDDETCGPDMIGLNPTSGPNGSTEDPAKDFRYFVRGNKKDIAESEDLDGCQVQQCTDWDGTTCNGTWVDVSGEFALDSTDPSVGDPLYTSPIDSCDPERDERAYRIQCDECGIYDTLGSVTGAVDASVECADCAVKLEKEVSCDDGNTYGESCTGWDGDAETYFKYTITNIGETVAICSDEKTACTVDADCPSGETCNYFVPAVDIDSCALTDADPDVLIPVTDFDDIGPIFPGQSASAVVWQNSICEDGEGKTTAEVDCLCELTRNGVALELPDFSTGPNVIGPNEVPSRTFRGDGDKAQNTRDTDDAELLCESVGLNISKTCDEQVEDVNAISVQVTNIAEADLTSCMVVDNLIDGVCTDGSTACAFDADCASGETCSGATNIPLSCYEIDGLCDDGSTACALDSDCASGETCNGASAVNPADFTLPGSPSPGTLSYRCEGSASGLERDTDNSAMLKCNVDSTTKTKDAYDDDTCEVPRDGCYTRTPGFWGTHPHIAELFFPVTSCGLTINDVLANGGNPPLPGGNNSSTEDMCSVGKDSKTVGTSNQQVQLERQCMAAALNIAASQEGGGSCSDFVERFGQCCGAVGVTDTCTAELTGMEINDTSCIESLDEFNNSIDIDFTWDSDTIVEDPFIRPGPANSQYCRESKNNGYLNPRDRGPRSN